jgi:3'-phosphoadenosine 5'-phosphosulfate sulfotransferase (PAPS reductase)/FAD synthetase
MEVLGLVALAGRALPHIILDHLLHIRKMKVTAKAVQRALDPLVALSVHSGQQLQEQR